jgi:2-polyprenyl-6-hydroxyphenyl methylase/3-demethylubiquinone-9 3-methyltransferase
VLDVGCGTGAFLAELERLGARVEGIELADERVLYARRVHGLSVHKHPLGSEHWLSQQASFDLVSLFDVLEHVDRPLQTLCDAAAMLRPGGVLAVTTPARDGAFHRLGALGYRLSAGRFPTLLELLYAEHKFGHKQILSSQQVGELIAATGLGLEQLELCHELSLPYASYLYKLLRSPAAAETLEPAARFFFARLPLRNKVRALARKR